MTQRPSQEIIEEGYKQARLNARCKALDLVLMAYQSGTGELKENTNGHGEHVKAPLTAEKMVAEAKLLEDYMLDGIQPPKASTIIQMNKGH